MEGRNRLACELLMAGLIQSYDDYRKVADHLVFGYGRDDILGMPELTSWAAACDWLRERL